MPPPSGMIVLALLFLASSQSIQLVNDIFRLSPGEWRAVNVALHQGQPVVVTGDFAVRSGSTHMRLELLRQADLERLRDGRPNGFLAMTPPGAAGRFRYIIRVPGDYAVILDNRGAREPALARLHVNLDFGERPVPTVRQLSPERQLVVILISFAVFFAIVTYSARRLLRVMKR